MQRRMTIAIAMTCAVLVMVPLLAGCGPAATATPEPPTATPAPTAIPAACAGHYTRATLAKEKGWENMASAGYSADTIAAADIASMSKGLDVKIFFSTSSGLSKDYVPSVLNILDKAGLPESTVSLLYCLDLKNDKDGLGAQWKVEKLPTFIFLLNGKEIGRIVEGPRGTLDGDIAQMLRSVQ